MRCPILSELPPPPPGKIGWPWTEESPQLPEKMTDGSPWPKISIVTPSRNQGEFIEETIRSVLLQGYSDLEYIIMDGGSTDDTVEVIRKYAPWLTHWVSEKDDGQTQAINRGFAKASGQILGYLNSDDIYMQGGLGALVGKTSRVDLEAKLLLAAPVEDFGVENAQRLHSNATFGRIDQWLDGGVSIHQPGCLWTKPLWQACGPFKEDLHYIFDRYFFTCCRIAGARLVVGPDTLAGFRLHPDSKTSLHFMETDNFSREWDAVKGELESRLGLGQWFFLKLRRSLRENWRLVSDALSGPAQPDFHHPLFAKLARSPLWLLHRPVAVAVARIAWRRASGLGRRFFRSAGKP